jgi:hypothetical protein
MSRWKSRRGSATTPNSALAELKTWPAERWLSDEHVMRELHRGNRRIRRQTAKALREVRKATAKARK